MENANSLESFFEPDIYSQRLNETTRIARERGIDAIVIATGTDFAYLTGSWISSHERLTALVLVGESRFIVVPNTDIADLKSSPIRDLDCEIIGWRDGQSPHQLVAEILGSAARVAVGSQMTADHLISLQALSPQAEWVVANEDLRELFMAKGPEEIAQLQAAAHAVDRVHARVPALLKAGRSEAEVAEDLRSLMLQEHDVVDFIIVGSAENGADPHHSYSDRVLEHGDPVVVDLGGSVGAGYHSDCTRTYVVGGDIDAAPEDFRQAYEVLSAAHQAACDTISPGVTAESIDRAARERIEAAGLGDLFIHRTGHGIGLSLHEEPFIMEGNTLELQSGMAFSVEPGLYRPGKWGMRLEDIVTATDEGFVSLNRASRKLQ